MMTLVPLHPSLPKSLLLLSKTRAGEPEPVGAGAANKFAGSPVLSKTPIIFSYLESD